MRPPSRAADDASRPLRRHHTDSKIITSDNLSGERKRQEKMETDYGNQEREREQEEEIGEFFLKSCS